MKKNTSSSLPGEARKRFPALPGYAYAGPEWCTHFWNGKPWYRDCIMIVIILQWEKNAIYSMRENPVTLFSAKNWLWPRSKAQYIHSVLELLVATMKVGHHSTNKRGFSSSLGSESVGFFRQDSHRWLRLLHPASKSLQWEKECQPSALPVPSHWCLGRNCYRDTNIQSMHGRQEEVLARPVSSCLKSWEEGRPRACP